MSDTLPPEGGGLDEGEFSALMDSIGTAAPLLSGVPGKGKGDDGKGGDCGRREALLIALKPYLSPERCELVEYLIRVGRIGAILRALR